MTKEEAIEILKQRECCRECVVDNGDCNDCDKAFEMAIQALENEETILKENKALKNRCKVYSQGLLCSFCPLECEQRSAEFRKVEQ